MRKLFIEGLVIFVSILASLSVDNMRESNEEKEILNEAVITLGDEINSNINYTKEHIKQVKNMYYLTAQVVDNYDEIRLKDVFKIHSENPYIHSIIENGKIEYKKQYSKEDYRVFVWTNAWEPENVFFQSMLYSGKLLEIKNKRLRKEVESIYTKQEERVSGMFEISGNISRDILKWFDEKENEFSKDISAAEIFDFHKDQKLKNALSKREKQLSERIIDLENYLQALQNVVMLISTEYKKI